MALFIKPTEKGCVVTSLSHIDLCGSIPAFLVNLGQTHPMLFPKGIEVFPFLNTAWSCIWNTTQNTFSRFREMLY
jgi:hypothetical protein